MDPEASLVPAAPRPPMKAERLPLGRRTSAFMLQPLPPPPGSETAPEWSKLALAREEQPGPGSAALVQLARTAGLPVAAGSLSLLGLGIAGGAMASLLVAAATSLVVFGVLRLPAARRWREQRLRKEHNLRAARTEMRLTAQMATDERLELGHLSHLVDSVRAQTGGEPGRRSLSPIAARLDTMLLAYVDRAIELRGVTMAYAYTDADPPELPATSEVWAAPRTERVCDRSFRIFHLRNDARAACRRRIQRIRRELHSIGQAVRLVHEQVLGANVRSGEIEGMLDEVLEEVELVGDAIAETAAVTARCA